MSVTETARLPVAAVVVATDGPPGASERARTSLEVAFPAQGAAAVVESLLRLTGVPTKVLHRIVVPDSAVPLVVVVAAVSIAVGLVSAALYLHSQVGIAFEVPGAAYRGTVAGGLAGSMAIIASTFPLLDRITGPEVARNE